VIFDQRLSGPRLHSGGRATPAIRGALRALGIAVALLGAAGQLQAQGTGRIAGRVVSAATGSPVGSAQVVVTGTTLRAVADVGGRFTIANVPAGTQSVTATSLGFAAKTVTGVEVAAGGTAELNISLAAEALALEGLTVTAASERGSVNRALDEQRTATGVVSSVTAEQISRSPDSDAAAAVQRVSGVTVQEGRYVFVRGLGERYTTTSLNGARIPSPEPERKVVPLDLFPAGLLQTITTSKTFTPDQPGDFSGAQVNIRTREYPVRRTATLSLSGGFNAAATGQDVFAAPTAGLEVLALGERDRRIPTMLIGGGVPSTPQQVNEVVNSFRDAWSPTQRQGRPNGSAALTLGGSTPAFGQRLGYVASGTYSYSQEVRSDEVRAYADPTGGTREIDRFEGMTGREGVLWGGVANLSTLLGSGSRISLNNTYNRTADNEARREFGLEENLGLPLRIDRLAYVERSVRSNQLTGEHEIGSRNRLDWSVTSAGVTRYEPDRSEVVYAGGSDPQSGAQLPFALLVDPQAAVRTFGALSENSLEASANYRFQFGDVSREHSIRVGGLYRGIDRDSQNRSYSILTQSLDRTQRELAPEEIFGGRFSSGSTTPFSLLPLNRGGSYAADDRLLAGYAMLEYAPTDWLRLIGGARVERSELRVEAEPTIGAPVVAEPGYTDVLPSLSANFQLSENQNLRLSASQTLSRPEYRELAPIGYRDVIGGETVIGNADLRRTLIQNADLRWEWYPTMGEVLSLALFAKRFQDPIERVYLGTSGTRVVTFVNADQAQNYGVELEARKELGDFTDVLRGFGVSANATLMRSDIDVDESDPLQTGTNRRMVGQAPYVANVGLSYATEGEGVAATLLFNTIGDRIVGASEPPLPDVVEEARSSLDLSLRFGLGRGLSGKFDARNLLDDPYRVTQGTVTRQLYTSGRVFTFGVSMQM
jgi:outer membrane receptor protein involved in Fe transport